MSEPSDKDKERAEQFIYDVAFLLATGDLNPVEEAAAEMIAETRHAEFERCKAFVAKEHHGQRADDRCIEDDDRLYAFFGLPPCDRRVGDKAAMLQNCARFIDRRCESGGWPTYAELEAEIKRLKGEVDHLATLNEDKFRHLQGYRKAADEDRAKIRDLEAENEWLKTALNKINDIRNSIIGLQTVNWSEHVYPLVAALNEVGIEGMPYPDGEPHFGTILERMTKAEAQVERLTRFRDLSRQIVTEFPERWSDDIRALEPGHTAEDSMLIDLANLKLNSIAKAKALNEARSERDALLAYIVRDSGLSGEFRFQVLLGGVVNSYETREEALAFLRGELERRASDTARTT